MFLVLDTITTMPIGLYTSIELAKAVMTQWKGPYCIARMEMDSSPSRKFENVFERHLNEESEDPGGCPGGALQPLPQSFPPGSP